MQLVSILVTFGKLRELFIHPKTFFCTLCCSSGIALELYSLSGFPVPNHVFASYFNLQVWYSVRNPLNVPWCPRQSWFGQVWSFHSTKGYWKSDKCNLPSRRLQVICMGARKNLTRQGTLEKRWGVCPSRTPFSLSLITSKRLLNRVKEVVRKCSAINHENRQYLLNSSWVNDHSWLGKPLCQSLILYIKRLCLATRLRGTNTSLVPFLSLFPLASNQMWISMHGN